MKEKIFQALKTKYTGVSDAILNRIAEKKSEAVKDESEIKDLVEGLTFQNIIDSEADFRASQTGASVKEKAIADYEKKFNLKDGKAIKNEETPKPPKPGEDENIPEWAKSILKQNEELANTVTTLSKTQQINSRKEAAKGLISKSKLPDNLKEKWISRINVESEDTSIEDQIRSLEEEFTDLQQNIINESVSDGERSGGNAEHTTEEIEAYLADKFPAQENGA